MALVVTKNLTDLWDSESVAGWTGISTTLYSGFQREGANCEGLSVSNTTETGYRSFTAFDMSASAVYVWFFVAGQMDTLVNGGIGIVLGDGTNRIAYHVGGSDSLNFNIGTVWSCLMIDGANPPANFTVEAGTEASLDFANITQVGVRFKTLSKALGGADNAFFDIARYGTGLTITGGGSATQGTFTELADDDFLTTAGKAYGIIREIQPGVFGVQGQLTFGDITAATDSYFEDIDATIIYEANGAGDAFYSMTVVGGTGTNEFILGTKVGTGDTAIGAGGCTIQSSGPAVDLDFDNASIVTHLYGCKLFKITGVITLSTTVTDEFIGNTADQCSQVIANQVVIRNCVFSGYSGIDAALLWNDTINIKNCQFNNNSDITNTPAGIEHPDNTGSPYTYDNLTFSGNDADIYLSHATLSIVVNASGGSNPLIKREGGTGTITINNNISITFTGLRDNTEIRVYEAGTTTELVGIENATAGTTDDRSFVASIAAGTSVDYRIHNTTYVTIENYTFTWPSSDQDLPVAQQFDRVYLNP